mmetsp:Transcript_133052/g.332091  ORF Transcript_133052/g.332091 Transcript_133052/m.332091 type:complete len:208 (+) Transcript_133052:347-970(+)
MVPKAGVQTVKNFPVGCTSSTGKTPIKFARTYCTSSSIISSMYPFEGISNISSLPSEPATWNFSVGNSSKPPGSHSVQRINNVWKTLCFGSLLCFWASRWHVGQASQMRPNSSMRCSFGPIIKVEPESGMTPHAVTCPGFLDASLQKPLRTSTASTAAVGGSAGVDSMATDSEATTEMPRKSKPQCALPTEPSVSFGSGPPNLSTPS